VRYAATNEFIAIRLSQGDDIHQSISQVCLENNVDSAIVTNGLGMVDSVLFGWFTGNDYTHEKISEILEISSINGDVSYRKDKLYVHLHAVLNQPDHSTISGHILEAKVHNNVEIFLKPLQTIILARSFDGWFDALSPQKRV